LGYRGLLPFGGIFVMSKEIGSEHTGARGVLRVVGSCFVFVGLIFVIVGMASFFSAFGGSGPPRYFWCASLGMPFLAVGGIMCMLGYMGAIGRYVVNEVAPVSKDAINYMADGTKEAIGDVAAVIDEGLRSGAGATEVRVLRCHKCNADNEVLAKFCKECGAAITKSKPCGICGELNDADAKFCDNCGKPCL